MLSTAATWHLLCGLCNHFSCTSFRLNWCRVPRITGFWLKCCGSKQTVRTLPFVILLVEDSLTALRLG